MRTLLFALAFLAGCNAVPDLSITPRVGRLALDGDIGVSSSGTIVSSSVEGLGLGNDETIFSPRVDCAWGPLDLSVAGYRAEVAGTGAAEASLDLGGVVINAGDPVRSGLDFSTYTAGLTYDFVPGNTFDLGLGIGVQSLDFDATIESISTGASIRSQESFLLPVLAARAELQLGSFGFTALASGLSGKASGVDATLINLDLAARYTFARGHGVNGDLVLGWQTMSLDVQYTDQGSDVAANLDIGGPYLGLTIGI